MRELIWQITNMSSSTLQFTISVLLLFQITWQSPNCNISEWVIINKYWIKDVNKLNLLFVKISCVENNKFKVWIQLIQVTKKLSYCYTQKW